MFRCERRRSRVEPKRSAAAFSQARSPPGNRASRASTTRLSVWSRAGDRARRRRRGPRSRAEADPAVVQANSCLRHGDLDEGRSLLRAVDPLAPRFLKRRVRCRERQLRADDVGAAFARQIDFSAGRRGRGNRFAARNPSHHNYERRPPFSTPDAPLEEARREQNQVAGAILLNRDHRAPEDGYSLEQQLGRLGRVTEDRGAVSVLDRRLVTKNAGGAGC